jgi:hypothetical protein
MQSSYPFEFEREMGCTEAELRAWLPEACGGRSIEWRDGGADIALNEGRVSIDWMPLPPRRIALISLPRTRIRFAAHDLTAPEWIGFMRRFDLHTQRGGG